MKLRLTQCPPPVFVSPRAGFFVHCCSALGLFCLCVLQCFPCQSISLVGVHSAVLELKLTFFYLNLFLPFNSSGFLEVSVSWFFDFDQSNNLAHSAGVFRLFIFNMITDRIEFKVTISTVVFSICPNYSLFFFPSLVSFF